ncbi:MAG TPA: cyclic-di-AMP receptor [Aggregatilineales bacterium]|nr:cyclic-di-AMP receptor [Aggregatilineales bacterium]
MKLIIAILQSIDEDHTIKALVKAGYRVTRAASTGGFFRQGNTTLMTGVEDHQVEEVMAILRRTCKQRTRLLPASPDPIEPISMWMPTVEVPVGGATVFILDVARFEQF